MSKKVKYEPKKHYELLRVADCLLDGLPMLGAYLAGSKDTVRGLSLFLGDTSEIVVGLRIFDAQGDAVVCWASGGDCIEALYNLDKRVGNYDFKIDKKFKEGYREAS